MGLFAAVATTVWYLAGGAGVGDYKLGWLRDGFDAYGQGVLVLGGTIAVWALLESVVSQELSDRHPFMTKLLEWPYSAALWSLRQTGLVIGATVLAVLTGVGVRAG